MYNQVLLIGRLTADPEIRATPTGLHVATLRLATNAYAGKDEDGNAKESTEYHSVKLFGPRAEFAGTYLHKGRLVMVSGRLHHDSWEDTTGVKKYRTEVIADELHALSPNKEAA